VARTLVNDQSAQGYWYGHNYDGRQYPLETAQAIIILNRTVFSSGVPVAVAEGVPNPGVVGQIIALDGSDSFHQDPGKTIVSWEWDLDDDGVFDVSGPVVTTSFGALGDFPVTLRVTDETGNTDTTTVIVRITTPPIAPTADADGPYVFCPQAQPWFLDGTGSVNPDEGLAEPGQPGDTIQTYAWELDGLDNDFDEASGPQPDVTAFFTVLGVGNYLIQLRVTDTTATSYPSSGFGDLSDTDATQVSVKAASDPGCACIDDLSAAPEGAGIRLDWTDIGAAEYHLFRGTTSGGPYVFLASIGVTTYLDNDVVAGTTYYYVVRPAALNGDELCQSNEAHATAQLGPAAVSCDVDGDGDIDRADLSLISRSRNQPASGPDDPRDANGDGLITPADVKACIPQCTLPGCAIQ
jgi:PKD repeat protein